MTTQTIDLPAFDSYGNYGSDNYGTNTLRFSVDGTDYYYSYRTLVAVKRPGEPIIVHRNDWGPTTGKHLNWIDGGTPEAKRRRLNCEAFASAVAS